MGSDVYGYIGEASSTPVALSPYRFKILQPSVRLPVSSPPRIKNSFPCPPVSLPRFFRPNQYARSMQNLRLLLVLH